MIIENVDVKIKKERLSSQSDDRIISIKLIVTVRDGDKFFDAELFQDVDAIEKDAIEYINHKKQNESNCSRYHT